MSLSLHEEDRRALDLLLDRSPSAANSGSSYVADGVSQERVRRVEKVLNLLAWMPDTDPPQDLVSKTIRRVQQSSDRALRPEAAGEFPFLHGTSQPHA